MRDEKTKTIDIRPVVDGLREYNRKVMLEELDEMTAELKRKGFPGNEKIIVTCNADTALLDYHS